MPEGKTLAETGLPSTNAGEIRDAIVSDIMAMSGAQAGNWYTVYREPGADVLLLGENRFQGPTAVADVLRTIEGQPYMQAQFGETAEDIDFAAMTRANDFEIQLATDLPAALVETFWDPGDLHCSIGFNAVVDDRYAGWVGAFRVRPNPPFEPELLARLRPRIPTYLRLLSAARIIDAARPGRGAILVVGQGGKVAARSAGAAHWLELPGFEARVAAAAAQLNDSGGSTQNLTIGTTSLRLFRLHGGDEPAFAVLVTPGEEMDSARLLSLSKRQREVVSAATKSVTVAEIGEQLGLSPETVKSHIKAVYDVFGISSRAELSRIVGSHAKDNC